MPLLKKIYSLKSKIFGSKGEEQEYEHTEEDIERELVENATRERKYKHFECDYDYRCPLPDAWNRDWRTTLFKQLVGQGFYVKKRIGKGAFSKVYFTKHYIQKISDDKKTIKAKSLACKVIDQRNTCTNNFNDKFMQREIDILRKISHPHILSAHSILQVGPFVCIFMSYCRHGDLIDYIDRNGPLTETRCKVYFYQLCTALNYLHKRNITHRDIKCENILVDSPYCVKLADFGFARQDLELDCAEFLCETFCGSVGYSAPEILMRSPYDPRATDMWALGCVLYIMIYRQMPFEDSNLITLLRAQLNKKLKFPNNNLITNDVVINLIRCLLEPSDQKRFKIETTLQHKWLSEGIQFQGAGDLDGGWVLATLPYIKYDFMIFVLLLQVEAYKKRIKEDSQ